MNEQKINAQYILAGTVAVLFTWLFHEFSHWLTSEILGHKAIIRLNVTLPINGENSSNDTDSFLFDECQILKHVKTDQY